MKWRLCQIGHLSHQKAADYVDSRQRWGFVQMGPCAVEWTVKIPLPVGNSTEC